MITAREAASLVDESEVIMTKRMDQISEKIKETATLGKRQIVLDYVLPYNDEYKVECPEYSTPRLTPVQVRIMTDLEKHGYIVDVIKETADFMTMFKNMDSDEEIERKTAMGHYDSWHITVRW